MCRIATAFIALLSLFSAQIATAQGLTIGGIVRPSVAGFNTNLTAIGVVTPPAPEFEFDDNASAQGSTAQDLSARAWSIEANRYYAQNGYIRIGSTGGYQQATKDLGSGKTRKMLIALPPASEASSATAYQGLIYYIFAPSSSKSLYVLALINPAGTTYGTFQLLNTAGYVTNISLGDGGVTAHNIELRTIPEPGDATQSTIEIYVDTVLVNTLTDQPNDYDATAPVSFEASSEVGKAVASRIAFNVVP